MGHTSNRTIDMTRAQRVLVTVVVVGAVVIASIGFAGSYAAVRELARQQGFGTFAVVFPIGVDAGIAVLLALDLLLTWLAIPFPLLRQAAWVLTAATIVFNAAAAWPNPIGVGMHAVIPVLFVVTVEAARHAVGRLTAITADRHMEGVRAVRWLLAPLATFLLWRKMRLWEIRRYLDMIRAEQDRLVYQARLHARYGRRWRRKAPLEVLLPLRLVRYGVPLPTDTRSDLPSAPSAPWSAAVPGRRERVEPEEQQAAAPEEGPATGLVCVCGTGTEQRVGRRLPAAQQGPASSRPAGPHRNGTGPVSQVPAGRRGAAPRSEPQEEQGANRRGTDDTFPPAPDAADRPSAAPAFGSTQADRAGQSAPVAGPQAGQVEGPAPGAEEHRTAIAGAASKADAIRYAVLHGPVEDTAIVEWLASYGQTVNRGQVYKVRRTAQRKREQQSQIPRTR